MAGGKGKRMELTVEKPLLPFMGKPLIEYAVDAARSARKVSKFFVVTSPNTPDTEAKCMSDGLPIIKTNGRGYHYDLGQAILKAHLPFPVLVIPSDLPALTGEFIDRVVSVFAKCKKDALAVFVPIEAREELNLSVSSTDEYNGIMYAVSGVNIINGAKIRTEGKIDTSAIITEEIGVLLNINTQNDLAIAERIIKNKQKSET
jgi:adenosylcobinamide-phosphate guanylyltransferase